MPTAPLEVVVRSAGGESLSIQKLDPGAALLAMRPQPCEAVLTEVDDGFVLSTPDKKVYLRLSGEQAQMWRMIDGRATVAEIVTAWFITVGSLDVRRVLSFMQVLRRAGLIEAAPVGFLRSSLSQRFALPEWRWAGMHSLAERIWAIVGGMFTGWTVPIWFTIVALGGWAINTETRMIPIEAATMAPVVVVAGLLHLALHELAHALAVVAAGRRIRHLGISFSGVYVDTTDLYLGTRAQHAVASLAGPAANLVLAAMLATLARATNGELCFALWTASATGFALALLTGWPFLIENDGYRAFCDMSGEPHLRKAGWIAVLAGKANPAQMLYSIGSVLTVALVIVFALLHAS